MTRPDAGPEELVREIEALRRRLKELEEPGNSGKASATAKGEAAERDEVEVRLGDSASQYQHLVEQLPAITYTSHLDPNCPPLFLSRQVERYLGFTVEECMRMPDLWRRRLHPGDRARVLGAMAQAAREGEPFTAEYRMLHRDGNTVWFHDEAVPIRGADGEILFFQGAMLDITDRRRVEETLQQSELLYHSTIESMTDSLHVVDRDLRFVLFNSRFTSWCRELGLKPGRIGASLRDIFPFLSDYVESEYEQVFATGLPMATQDEVEAGGRTIITETHKTPIIEDGRTVRVVTIVRDITAKEQAEAALRRSEEAERRLSDRLAALQQVSNRLVMSESFDQLCRQAVALGRAELGFERLSLWFLEKGGDLVGGSFGVDEEGRIRDERAYSLHVAPDSLMGQVLRGRGPVLADSEGPLLNADAKVVSRGFHAVAGLRDGDRLIGCLSVDNLLTGQQFTERDHQLLTLYAATVGSLCSQKRTEERLRHSERRYRELADALPQTVFELDLQGRLVFANRAGEEMFGYSMEEVLNRQFGAEMLVPEDCERAKANIQRVLAGEDLGNVEYRAQRKDGSTFPVLIHSSAIMRQGRPGGLRGIVIDITDRKQAEERRAAMMLGLRSIVDSAAELIACPGVDCLCREAVAFAHDRLGLERCSIRVQIGDQQRGAYGIGPDGSVRPERDVVLEAPADLWRKRFAEMRARGCRWLLDCGELSYWPKGDHVHVGRDWQACTPIPAGDPADHAAVFINDAPVTHAPLDEIKQELLAVFCSVLGHLREHRRMDEVLQQSEALFRAVFESNPHAVAVWDRDHNYLYANPAAARLARRSAAELVGSPIAGERGDVPPFVRLWMDRLDKVIASGQAVQTEERVPLDGKTVWAEITMAPVKYERGRLFAVVGVTRDVTERKDLERQILEISSREQRRIGQDLHDALGQDLTGLAFLLSSLEKKLAGKKLAEADDAARLVRLVNKAIGQVKSLARGLAPVDLGADGLREALYQLAAHTRSVFGIDCNLEYDDAVQIEDRTVAGNIHRIAQEAVSNAVRHSGASEIRLSLRSTAGRISLEVTDDGIGIPADARDGVGMGLRSMTYRAGVIGARLTVRARMNGGTTVLCTIADV